MASWAFLGFKEGAALVIALSFDCFDLLLTGQLVFQRDRGGGSAAGFLDGGGPSL